MKYQFGFIGCGNMGGALAQAVAKSVSPAKIALCDTDINKAAALAEACGTAIETSISASVRA